MTHHYGTRTQTRAAASTTRNPTEEENLQDSPHPSLNELEGSLSNTPERRQLDPLDIIMEEGRKLGFEGAELRQYVIEEKRFMIKKESERQEAERKERQEEREAARKERERREEREHELARLRLQAETGLNRNGNATDQAGVKDSFRPRIPYLEDKDDVEAWFLQYEHYCLELNLDENQKASRILYFLKGKARELYSGMKEEEQREYDTIKSTLFNGFHLTDDDYRMKFRQIKKEPKETYKEMIVRMEKYLDKWFSLAGAEESVENMKNVVLMEQALDTLPTELAIHVKQHKPSSTDDLIELVKDYERARYGLKKVAGSTNEKNDPKHRNGPFNKNENPRHKNHQGGKGLGYSGSAGNTGIRADGTKSLSPKEEEELRKKGACFRCKEVGHMSKNCPTKKKPHGNVGCISCYPAGTNPIYVMTCPPGSEHAASIQTSSGVNQPARLDKLCLKCQGKPFQNIVKVKVNGKETTALRDTGCTGIIVSADLVEDNQFTEDSQNVTLASQDVTAKLRVAVVKMDSPYFENETEVSVMEKPLFPVLIGQTYGVGEKKGVTPLFPVRDPSWYHGKSAAVTTRLQRKKDEEEEREKVVPAETSGERTFTPADLKKEQESDPSLARIRQFAREEQEIKGVQYVYKNEILLRVVTDKTGTKHSKVVVPKKMRAKVLSFGHDHAMAGHLGFQKTADRIKAEFWWPGFFAEIKRYVASCDTCQRTTPKGKTPRVPLGKSSTVNVMFKKVAIDIVGPIEPMSDTKKRYILVVIDYSTRYPEAVPLKDISAKSVVDALWEIWTRLGVPDQIVTDQGSQFTGHLMREINELLKIKHSMTAPFHPQANGLVEKFNGTLKSMLRKLALE